MHRKILQIALPSIVSNITVPLLALADTAIVGHLGAAAYIGAIALGGMLFNMVYWLFAFLRMGTGGMTAQAYGAGDILEAHRILRRSLAVALGVSACLIILQQPFLNVAFKLVTATPEVELHARTYFSILVWGAPAVLGLYSFSGWFLGMQNAKAPMAIAIVQNVLNIAVSLWLVFGLHLQVAGVATGTLVAQYAGLAIALFIWWIKYRQNSALPASSLHSSQRCKAPLCKFFRVNSDIFLRTLTLIAVTTYFTAQGSAQGELTLAANTLLMQLYLLFSYIMDGFAYAGEAVGGRYYGAGDASSFRLLTRHLFRWGLVLAALFTVAYVFCGTPILHLLTNEANVVEAAREFLPFVWLVPFVSFAAFLFDGLFIGTTATRFMLWSMATAVAVFFCLIFLLPVSNYALWAAFLVYLGIRGIVQALLFPRIVRQIDG